MGSYQHQPDTDVRGSGKFFPGAAGQRKDSPPSPVPLVPLRVPSNHSARASRGEGARASVDLHATSAKACHLSKGWALSWCDGPCVDLHATSAKPPRPLMLARCGLTGRAKPQRSAHRTLLAIFFQIQTTSREHGTTVCLRSR